MLDYLKLGVVFLLVFVACTLGWPLLALGSLMRGEKPQNPATYMKRLLI